MARWTSKPVDFMWSFKSCHETPHAKLPTYTRLHVLAAGLVDAGVVSVVASVLGAGSDVVSAAEVAAAAVVSSVVAAASGLDSSWWNHNDGMTITLEKSKTKDPREKSNSNAREKREKKQEGDVSRQVLQQKRL